MTVASDVFETKSSGAQHELIMMDFVSKTEMLGTTVICPYVHVPLKEENMLWVVVKRSEIISEGLIFYFCKCVLCKDQTKFLYWAKLVFRVTRLQLPAGLVIPVNQVIS